MEALKSIKNMNFIFASLKMLKKHGFNFFYRRTHEQKKHGFTFLESMKVQKIRIQSFCKLQMLRHAQIQSVKTAKCFRKRQSHFLQTQTVHKCSFQQNVFPKNGGKRFALAWALRAHPHFLEKIFCWKEHLCTVCVCKNGTGAFWNIWQF